MATDENYVNQLIENAKRREFTSIEAINFMKEIEKFPVFTNTNCIKWIDTKIGSFLMVVCKN